MFLEMLLFIGFGLLIGLAIPIMAITLGKKQYPHLYINFIERQNGIVAEVLKARLVKKKDTKDWFVKVPVLSGGIGSLFAKETIINDPDETMAITNKAGGIIMITRQASPNVLLPCKIEINKDENKLNLILKYINIGNWYKGKVKFNAKSEILHPKSFLGQHPEIKIIAAGITFVMIMVIYTAMVHPILMQMMSEQSSAVTGFTQAIKDLTSSIGGVDRTILSAQ